MFYTKHFTKTKYKATVTGAFDKQTANLSIGISVCSPKDVFTKYEGRFRSERKASNHDSFDIRIPTGLVKGMAVPTSDKVRKVFYAFCGLIENNLTDKKSVKKVIATMNLMNFKPAGDTK